MQSFVSDTNVHTYIVLPSSRFIRRYRPRTARPRPSMKLTYVMKHIQRLNIIY